jgi:hypothetical protein
VPFVVEPAEVPAVVLPVLVSVAAPLVPIAVPPAVPTPPVVAPVLVPPSASGDGFAEQATTTSPDTATGTIERKQVLLCIGSLMEIARS